LFSFNFIAKLEIALHSFLVRVRVYLRFLLNEKSRNRSSYKNGLKFPKKFFI
jgi:hypothetical protein